MNTQQLYAVAKATCLSLALVAFGGCNENNTPETVDPVLIDGDVGLDGSLDVAADTAPDVQPEDAAQDTTDAAPDVAPDIAPDVPPDLPEIVSYAFIDTVVALHTVPAGAPIGASCVLLNPEGEEQPVPVGFAPRINFSPEDMATRDGDGIIAVKTGAVRVWCSAPALGLTDNSAVDVTIVPGEVASTIATVSPHVVHPNEPITVTCEARDAYDNLVPDAELTVEVAPHGDVEIDGDEVRATVAGLYEARCTSAKSVETYGDAFEVLPGQPQSLVLAVEPARSLYGLGDVVAVVWEATDAYGNLIPDANVSLTSDPNVPMFGLGRFRLNVEGVIRITGTLPRYFGDGAPLRSFVEVLVNEDGPAIECQVPFNGAIVDRSPTGTILLEGSVSDAIGVDSVLVNGEEASLSEGWFTHEVPIRYGINFVSVEAVDSLGERNSRTCAFLVADDFIEPNGFLDDGVTLRLGQDAMDDSNRSDGFDSIADLLHSALNSPAIRNTIHDSFRSDPVLFDECIQDSFVGCIIDARVRYLDSRVRGPNTVSLTLVNDGLRAVMTVRDAAVKLDINTIVNTDGWVTLRSITIDMTIHLGVRGGVPTVTGTSINRTDVGGISTDFSGLSGDILGALADLFEDDIRDALRDAVRDFLTDSLDDVVGGLFESLDIDGFGDEFEVDKLDGTGSITLGFGLRFSTVTTNAARALFGIGMRVTGPPGRPAGPGTPMYPGGALFDAGDSRTISAAVSFGLLEQAVFALWRAAFFDITVTDATVDSLPEGSQVSLDIGLPPVVTGTDDGRIAFMLGAIQADILIPSLLAETLTVDLGIVVSASVTIEDDETLVFGEFIVDELHLSTPNASLSEDTRAALETYLSNVLQRLASDALNSALPALPIPSFEMPGDLVEFGLPAGVELGLLAPAMRVTNAHFVAEGNFGVQ